MHHPQPPPGRQIRRARTAIQVSPPERAATAPAWLLPQPRRAPGDGPAGAGLLGHGMEAERVLLERRRAVALDGGRRARGGAGAGAGSPAPYREEGCCFCCVM